MNSQDYKAVGAEREEKGEGEHEEGEENWGNQSNGGRQVCELATGWGLHVVQLQPVAGEVKMFLYIKY